MKDYFPHDYPPVQLSKYFMLFIDKMCHKLGFHVYYNPRGQFIVSDHVLNDDYRYYKTTEQIKEEKPVARWDSESFYWQKKTILLFDKEEAYEQDDGEWYYPDYHDCQHDIDFKMSVPNMQKLLLCVFKNPILQTYHYTIRDIFSTYDTSIYFPSESINVNEKLDLLLVRNLDQCQLLEKMLRSSDGKIATILQKKSSDYLVEFFKSFGKREDLEFKDFIFKVTQNQDTLQMIFENFPVYNKFLSKNTPTEFLSKETQKISIFKSFFNIPNLSLKYHEQFNESAISNHLLKIFEVYSLKQTMAEKGIIIHHAFHDYSSKSIISIIENKSPLSIEKIEDFFCEAIIYIEQKNSSYASEQPNLLKFFQYFYQNEVSLLNHIHRKNPVTKI